MGNLDELLLLPENPGHTGVDTELKRPVHSTWVDEVGDVIWWNSLFQLVNESIMPYLAESSANIENYDAPVVAFVECICEMVG